MCIRDNHVPRNALSLKLYVTLLLRGLKFLDSKLALYDKGRRKGRKTVADVGDIGIHFVNFDVTAVAYEWKVNYHQCLVTRINQLISNYKLIQRA